MEEFDFSPDDLEAAGALAVGPDPGYTYPDDPLVAENLKRWQDHKFGVIIHWGIYSSIGQAGSWSLHREHLGSFTDKPAEFSGTDAEYHSWYLDRFRDFEGKNFEASEWAKICARAGMRYMVFTTKHHDGYCLYDSAYTNFKSTSEEAGLKRDIFAEVTEAFRAEGLETGVYFSKADWSRAEYWDRSLPISNRFANYSIEDNPRKWQRFVEFTHDQIAELLTNYGQMNVLWLDAGWVRPPEEPIDIDGIAKIARDLQPGILVVDREVHGVHENYRTPEQRVPDSKLDMPWECCLTLTRSWCSLKKDDPTKPTSDMIETLLAVVSRGGNLLLGIGPDGEGGLSRHIVDSLNEIGEWMDVYGHAIYGSRALDDYTEDEFGQVSATINGEKVPTYSVRTEDGSVALFILISDRETPTQIDITGLPAGYVAQALGGETLSSAGSPAVSLHSDSRFACGVSLRKAMEDHSGQWSTT
ncbi:alpha-L-fucosidase [Bowdeniella massiliensis]|uniref:alpha-L-fucosidase n=1 Tax=Bowdeniella massiliensis TaxID=2932264 RepID=UPI00202872A1|nr:alpha-L-fucosidase [Bowdeniella massiliensis]